MRDKEQRKANHRESTKKQDLIHVDSWRKLKGLSSTVIQLKVQWTLGPVSLCKDRNSQLTFTHSQLTKWDPQHSYLLCRGSLCLDGGPGTGCHCCDCTNRSVTVPTHLQDLQGRTGQLLSTAQPDTLQLWSLGMGGDSHSSLSYGFSGYISLTSYYNLMSIYKINKNYQQETASPLLKFKHKKFGLELSQIYCF